MTRILIVAHGHPELSVGGGEIAAYNHCTELRRLGHKVAYMGWTRFSTGRDGTPFRALPGRPDDILFHSSTYDYFLQSQRTKTSVHEEFRSFLERFRPEIVHFHHYLHLGLELIREVRKYGATVPIFLTLHEYIAICFHDGQMVTPDGRLCERSSSFACHQCFPNRAPQDFFLRELFIKSYLGLVDRFIAPSRFLMQRYIDWGIAPERIAFLENGQVADGHGAAAAAVPDDPARLCRRFAFFGQISRLKGIFVLLEAAAALPKRLRREIRIDIHGSYQHQDDEFRERFHAAVADAGVHVRFAGSYKAADLPRLMRDVGWVLVPSVWWENSPLVIQEAFTHRRPVICSDIGGMAEKVHHGETGLHFRMGHAGDLAATLEAAADPALWESMQAQIAPPPTIADAVGDLLDLYARSGRVAQPAA